MPEDQRFAFMFYKGKWEKSIFAYFLLNGICGLYDDHEKIHREQITYNNIIPKLFFFAPLYIALELLWKLSWIVGFWLSQRPGLELCRQMMHKLLTAMALCLPCLELGQLGHTKGFR